MSHSSEDETDISDSELDDYVERCYKQLSSGNYNVKFSKDLFRCPFCPGKKKLVYQFKDLLRHATDVGKGSVNRDIKHKGKHLGLVKYMKTDLESPNEEEDLSSQFAALTVRPEKGGKQLFVWPWLGIIINLDRESCSKIKTDLANKGFNPVRVRPLCDGDVALVEFKRDWSGFYDALMFEKEFEVDHRGKTVYCSPADKDDGLYGWVARDDDYYGESVVSEFLQKIGDLKTLEDVENEEKRKNGLLVADLTNTIEELRKRVDMLEGNSEV